MKTLRIPLGPWCRGLIAALLLAGASAPGVSLPKDAVAAVAVVIVSIGFPISLARATVPSCAPIEGRPPRLAFLTAHAARRQPAPRAPSDAPRSEPPAFLRHRSLLR